MKNAGPWKRKRAARKLKCQWKLHSNPEILDGYPYYPRAAW